MGGELSREGGAETWARPMGAECSRLNEQDVGVMLAVGTGETLVGSGSQRLVPWHVVRVRRAALAPPLVV